MEMSGKVYSPSPLRHLGRPRPVSGARSEMKRNFLLLVRAAVGYARTCRELNDSAYWRIRYRSSSSERHYGEAERTSRSTCRESRLRVARTTRKRRRPPKPERDCCRETQPSFVSSETPENWGFGAADLHPRFPFDFLLCI